MFKILLVRPHIEGLGGVSNYYRAVVPHLKDRELNIRSFEIGSFKKSAFNLHPIVDQIRYASKIQYRPDLIHLNPSLGWKSFFRDGLFVWQAKRKGIRVLVFFRGWDNQFAKKVDKYFKCFFRATFAKADKFIVLASDFEIRMKQWGLKKPVKLSTTVVDERLLTDFNLKKKLNRLENEQSFKILYLARLEKEKGVFEVVDSVKILIDRGLNVSLAIAGDGPFLDELELYISSLKLPQGKIQLLGYVKGKDKIKALTNCSIYCFPSYYGEGLPNSVLEAIAFASPVITTSVGGLADFFRDGEMGIFVEPKNCDQLAETMESLIKNRIKLLQMAKYNYDYAQQYLLAPKIADFLKHTYKEMIKTETC